MASYSPGKWQTPIPVHAGVLLIIGLGVGLYGWIFDLNFARHPIPSLAPVHPWSMVLLAGLGLCLVFLGKCRATGSRWRWRTAQTLGAALGFISVYFLGENALCRGATWVDSLLFPENIAAIVHDSTGRPSPEACATFLVFAVSVLLFRPNEERAGAFTVASILGLFFPILALSGFLIYSAGFNGMDTAFLGMSLPVAALCIVLGSGFVALSPRGGLGYVFDPNRFAGAIVRRLLPMAAGGPVLLGSIVYYVIVRGNWNGRLAVALLVLLTIVLIVLVLLIGDLVQRQQEAERRAAEAREQLLEKLRASHARIESLQRSVLVICAWTKTVWNGERWIPVEEFLSEHLDIPVSHGISEEAFRRQLQTIGAGKASLNQA
ncbi:MAG: hypothetical protein JO015_16785 [Verrucomicrobia bacterium]|nr:hypothetical protein [Verrucomicrobiota bacterium]